jgi:hypothetical protein
MLQLIQHFLRIVMPLHFRAVPHAVPRNFACCGQATDLMCGKPDHFTHCFCIDKASLANLDNVVSLTLWHGNLQLTAYQFRDLGVAHRE